MPNEDHRAIKKNKMKFKDLSRKYHNCFGGFSVSFGGTDHNRYRLNILFISWRDLIEFLILIWI